MISLMTMSQTVWMMDIIELSMPFIIIDGFHMFDNHLHWKNCLNGYNLESFAYHLSVSYSCIVA